MPQSQLLRWTNKSLRPSLLCGRGGLRSPYFDPLSLARLACLLGLWTLDPSSARILHHSRHPQQLGNGKRQNLHASAGRIWPGCRVSAQ
ncbi:hypothetical protein PoB_002008200 [Plakobranchus ocellatus]|uniref:Uncharacterized protein n=1 Tax=Plakobranchus ocellatus TaxID=259542 RepID=A0AAV3ZGB6_9GAST|nr:hypothetical protein PoB_002008200 [Plakobranchus ocellatus]